MSLYYHNSPRNCHCPCTLAGSGTYGSADCRPCRLGWPPTEGSHATVLASPGLSASKVINYLCVAHSLFERFFTVQFTSP
jgi:hypothetical protein